MGNQAKIEIVNDFVWFRKGDKMSALDVICKFCYVASKAISADPSKNIDEKQAKKKLMQLIFAGTGVLITDSGNISTRKNGGLEKNAKVKINRVLKMGSSDFDLANEKYTCPSDGKYLFTWGINLTANENAKFDLGGFYFYKNNSHNIVGGNTQELSSLYMDMRGNPTRGAHISNTVIVDCSATDYFTLKGFYNDVDGSGDQGGLISEYYTSWGGYKLID